ncbi:hypothetical protein [Rhodococcus qingshengii]|uniref:hypothetical protein n=1 Tax=Rhodococcus qingshengii TaxID=334542 RepID=UPI0035E01662
MRIKKMMGYALLDIQENDPRINWASPFLHDEQKEELLLDDYAEFLEEHPDHDAALERSIVKAFKVSDRNLQDAVLYDPENGLGNILIVCPVSMAQRWVRNDDDLDKIEYTYNYARKGHTEIYLPVPRESLSPELTLLDPGPYPYKGYMDRVTGEPCHPQTWAWKGLQRDRDGDGVSVQEAREEMSSFIGYGSFAEAVDRVVPKVPSSVRLLAQWGDLFLDPGGWKGLRPVLYTYFS